MKDGAGRHQADLVLLQIATLGDDDQVTPVGPYLLRLIAGGEARAEDWDRAARQVVSLAESAFPRPRPRTIPRSGILLVQGIRQRFEPPSLPETNEHCMALPRRDRLVIEKFVHVRLVGHDVAPRSGRPRRRGDG